MKKKARKKEAAPIAAETFALETAPKLFYESPAFWWTACAFVVVLGSALRFVWLSLKPFHHDEGVNGFFLITLFKNNTFKYDPSNYHGPTLYFITLISGYLFGLNDFAVRFVTAFFGVLVIIGILSLHRYLGKIGALAAALLVAISPGMTFISRYFIHEMLFVFFTFAVVLGVVKFIERERVGSMAVGATSILLLVCQIPAIVYLTNRLSGTAKDNNRFFAFLFLIALAGLIAFWLVYFLLKWRAGTFIYLLLAAVAASLSFATKETAFITFGTMLIAIVCTILWQAIWPLSKETTNKAFDLSFKNFFQKIGNLQNGLIVTILCFGVFAYLWALFFTSFFTFEKGIEASFKAYDLWSKTSSTAHTQNGFWAYFRWLWQLEAPILLLAVVGTGLAFWKANNKFAIFVALWGWGLTAAYTLISYKTPWLAINFILPLALTAGYAIQELAVSRVLWQRYAAAFLAALAFGVGVYQCVSLNFYRYDDSAEPYIYAHSKREFLDLVREINRTAEISGKNNETSIAVVSPDYWPMPWYLRDYKNVGFHGKIVSPLGAEIIVGSFGQESQLEANYASNYTYVGLYPLRPGVDLMLYVRNDLAQKSNNQ